MKVFSAFIAITLFSFSSTLKANETFSLGEEIHEDSCSSCHVREHDEDFYTRKDRVSNSYVRLESLVRMCDAKTNTKLFDDDIEFVTEYLNEAYFQFNKS